MSQAIFVVRAKQVSGPGIIYRMWSRCHNSLGSLRLFLFMFISASSGKTKTETWKRERAFNAKKPPER
jgi:hypothetical protein